MKTYEKIEMILLVFVVYIFMLATFPAHSSETIEKIGECPPGWSTSGKYCVPGKYAKYIMERRGECPIGFQTAGKYCIKTGK